MSGIDTADLARRVRRHAVQMTSRGRSSHVASVLSCADILAVLYGGVARVDPANPSLPERDRVILSKGHAGAGIYAVLAERGFFPAEDLARHCADGSVLSGHVSHKGVPGVEFSTGSLGHGLPVATGMALRLQRTQPSARVFCVLSDGECDEGTTWESALIGAHHSLGNLCAIVDANGIQSLAPVSETLELEPFGAKWSAFGWDVREVDGHAHDALRDALRVDPSSGRPVVVIARTTKGRGVSFMEDSVLWHYRSPQGEELERALEELA